MATTGIGRVESEAMMDFACVMGSGVTTVSHGHTESGPVRARLNLDPENVKNGLGQLVLTLVKLLHELLEKQAVRRIEAGSLTQEQIERLGLTLMRQNEQIHQLRREFNLSEEDLNLDLGPLGQLF